MDQDRRLTITTFSLIVIGAAILTTALLYYFGPTTSRLSRTTTSTSPALRQFFPVSEQKKTSPSPGGVITGEESTSTIGGTIGFTNHEAITTASKLFKITESAVAGSFFGTVGGTSSPLYLERSTGHLYRIRPDSHEVERLTNTTLPGTQELYWGQDGKSLRLVLRSIKTGRVDNFSGIVQIASSTEAGGIFAQSGEIKGASWTEPIVSLAASPDHTQVFTLRTTSNGVTGYASGWGLKDKKQLFTSASNEWLVTWPEANTILLVTKPAKSLLGSAFLLNTKKGGQKTLLSDKAGLSVILSPNGQKAFYSESVSTSFKSYLYDLKTGKSSPLNFTSLPEKCLWASDSQTIFCAVPNIIRSATYPDDWYRSEISFEDSLWKTNIVTGETTMLLNTAESNLSLGGLDAIDLFLDNKGRYLFFTNKTDGTLWMFALD
jgi:hypothetical protein